MNYKNAHLVYKEWIEAEGGIGLSFESWVEIKQNNRFKRFVKKVFFI